MVKSNEIGLLIEIAFMETGKLVAHAGGDHGHSSMFDDTSISDTFPLNEFMTVSCYQIYDTFLEKYVIRIRANGTVIRTKEWNSTPPNKITGVKVWTVDTYLPLTVLLSNTYLFQLP